MAPCGERYQDSMGPIQLADFTHSNMQVRGSPQNHFKKAVQPCLRDAVAGP